MMPNPKIILSSIFVMCLLLGCQERKTCVLIHTELGDIRVELYPDRAPITVANFLRYVDEGLFQSVTFYRTVRMANQPDDSVKIEVIQGGLDADTLILPPIEHETTARTGILHKDGVISMARLEPGTAAGEFFICVGDQPELDYGGRRNLDGQGFAAFGRVTGGMEVVRTIHARPADGQRLKPHIDIISIVRADSRRAEPD